MILKAGTVAPKRVAGSAPRQEERVALAGGLRAIGANITTLMPGEKSSQRHWHETEDELLYMIEGRAVVVENDGAHDIGPGDICCWPAGVPNAHHVWNRSDAPVRYLVVGSNPVTDRCHYPDEGETLFHEPPRWWVERTDGTVVREGATD